MLAIVRSLVAVLALGASSAALADDYHTGGLAFGKNSLSSQSNKAKAEPSAPPGWDASKSGAWDSVKFSNANPSQAGSYSGGNLFNLGSGRINDCKTATPTTDRVANQDCDAVNFLAKNPTTRKKFTISGTDPILAAFEGNMKNAKDSLDPAKCVKKMVEDPAIHEIEFCNEYLTTYPAVCDPERIVEVDVDSNFQCDVQYKSLEEIPCRRGNTVNVGFGKCTANALLTKIMHNTCPRCYDPYVVMDVYCDGAGTGYRVHRYTSSNGSNIYTNMGSSNISVAPGQSTGWVHAGNFGQGCTFNFYFSQSCASNVCTPAMMLQSSGCNGSSFSKSGAPIVLPIEKTLVSWTQDQCLTLRARSQ